MSTFARSLHATALPTHDRESSTFGSWVSRVFQNYIKAREAEARTRIAIHLGSAAPEWLREANRSRIDETSSR